MVITIHQGKHGSQPAFIDKTLLPSPPQRAANLVFSGFEGLRWTVDSFSAVKKLFSCFAVLWSIWRWM